MTGFDASHFINRELSWLEFDQRVLEEALDGTNPLLERLKFFSIFSSNLDEFFEVRVAGVKQQMESEVMERSVDGLTAAQTFYAITQRVHQLVRRQCECWNKELVPALEQRGIRFLDFDQLEAADVAWLDRYYRAEIRPVLTPLAIDPAHPFPQLLNKSLNLMVELEVGPNTGPQPRLAIVPVPRILPRLIRLPREDGRVDGLRLGRLIGHYLSDLFAGATIKGYWPFRITRNSELYIDEEETVNLLLAVENELHKRRRGDAVRLEVELGCPRAIQTHLLANLHLDESDVYAVDGPLNPTGLLMLYEGDHSPELRDAPFVAPLPAAFREARDVFGVLRKHDLLLHHPYDSFEAVVNFLEQAAEDPDVLAIKQTLYRTGGDPRIIGALMKAVHRGKQVTAVVELKARFDEANNIAWARRLEEAGVHVVYGLVGLKIHCKICLIVRREELGIRRYVHLSTGNYNPITARVYTDLSLFTCAADFGEDATNLFNLLTGICQFQRMRELWVAPFDLHGRLLALIERETANARQGLPARIIAKMNSLVDREIIQALYRASQAGVKIDLIVRGVCCLRPQLKKASGHITVRSIVDRFLEHSRILYVENACRPEVYVGSADWMPRNFFRRLEVVFPIKDGVLKERLCQEILGVTLADNVKARFLRADGTYRAKSLAKSDKPLRSQTEFIQIALGKSKRLSAARRTTTKPIKVTLSPPPAREEENGET